MDGPTWIALVNRLLRAKQRPDPKKPGGGPIYWRQGDLALAARVRPNTLSDIMQGKSEPSIETLGHIARALDVPLSYMFMSEGDIQAFERGKEQTQQSNVAEALREEMRGFFMARMDDMFDKVTAEFEQRKAQPPETQGAPAKRKKSA